MKFKQTAVISIILSLILVSSCTTWSKKDWDELIDRTFYFQKFKYTYKGSSREHSYYFMKEFPMKEMLGLIEKKYNIKIDTTEYDKFLLDGNFQKEVKSVSGTFLDNDFTWEAKTKQRYEIWFEYMTLFSNEGDKSLTFELEIITNKKTRKYFFGNIFDKKNVIEKLTKKLEDDK
jgi:hypothetical protein